MPTTWPRLQVEIGRGGIAHFLVDHKAKNVLDIGLVGHLRLVVEGLSELDVALFKEMCRRRSAGGVASRTRLIARPWEELLVVDGDLEEGLVRIACIAPEGPFAFDADASDGGPIRDKALFRDQPLSYGEQR
jgi:hypothetical protein